MAPSATQASGHHDDQFHFKHFHNVINGKLTSTMETRHSINPATTDQNPAVPVSTQKDVDDAVTAARTAFRTWSKTSVEDRRKGLHGLADAIMEHKDAFIEMLIKEQGKPRSGAEREVNGVHGIVKEVIKMSVDEEIIEETPERKIITRYTPLGVVCGIVPWNFPLLLALLKVVPALLTGNVIIIKPSPFTPYCGLKMAELAQRFFPPGVVQALSGDDNLGPWLTEHEDIDKISFTGSSATGKRVMASAAKTLKRVTLELGGNDAAIICPDINVQKIAPKIATLAFVNSGQVCLALKRIYIHEDIYDELRDAMVKFTKTMKVGEGHEEGVALGPIQNLMQYERVKGFFSDIEKHGQKVAVGGTVEKSKGYFINPTIIDKPEENSRLVTEEPFGPIVPILAWKDEADVIARANDTKMGLGGSVWCNDMERAERIARQLEAGAVWINSHLEHQPYATIGGHKWSGIGSELGKAGIAAFCNTQSLFIKKP